MRALSLTVPLGGSIVEVGTLTGTLRRYMLGRLKPSRLVAIDVSDIAISMCKKQHADQIAAGTVQCLLGDSKKMLATLPEDSVDLMCAPPPHTPNRTPSPLARLVPCTALSASPCVYCHMYLYALQL